MSVEKFEILLRSDEIRGTLREELSTLYCFLRKYIAMKALSWSEIASGSNGRWGGANITRTRHDVTLYVHCLSCIARCKFYILCFESLICQSCVTSHTAGWASMLHATNGRDTYLFKKSCVYGIVILLYYQCEWIGDTHIVCICSEGSNSHSGVSLT